MTEIDSLQLLRQVRQALQQNDYPSAIHALEQIVAQAQARGDNSAARHLGNLALTYYRMGQPLQALTHFEQALTLARQDADGITQSGLLGNMGNILREVGRYTEAILHLTQALEMSQAHKDTRGQGIWLSNLGLVYDDLHEPQRAADYHARAADIARQLFDQPNLAARLHNLGLSLAEQGDYLSALEQMDESVTLYEILGRTSESGQILGRMGNLYVELAHQTPNGPEREDYYQQAIEHYERTLELAHELGDYATEAELLMTIGYVCISKGHPRQARPYFQTSAQVWQNLGQSERVQQIQALLHKLD